jgi:hypothetical protein
MARALKDDRSGHRGNWLSDSECVNLAAVCLCVEALLFIQDPDRTLEIAPHSVQLQDIEDESFG